MGTSATLNVAHSTGVEYAALTGTSTRSGTTVDTRRLVDAAPWQAAYTILGEGSSHNTTSPSTSLGNLDNPVVRYDCERCHRATKKGENRHGRHPSQSV